MLVGNAVKHGLADRRSSFASRLYIATSFIDSVETAPEDTCIIHRRK
jgi:hypothetical protein